MEELSQAVRLVREAGPGRTAGRVGAERWGVFAAEGCRRS